MTISVFPHIVFYYQNYYSFNVVRPIQYNKTEVLERAMQLFWTKGYRAVSVQDIMEATGFNRHSLYAQFGSKDGLYRAILELYTERFEQRANKSINPEKDGINGLIKLFVLRLQPDLDGRGCLVSNTFIEKEYVSEECLEAARRYTEKQRFIVRQCLEYGRTKGQINAEKDLDAATDYIVTMLQGLGVMSRSGLIQGLMDTIRQQTFEFLKN